MTNRQHYRCADGLPQPEKSAGLREAAADVSTMIEMTTRCSGELPLPLLRPIVCAVIGCRPIVDARVVVGRLVLDRVIRVRGISR